MTFDRISENDRLICRLREAIQKESLHHAYLFEGSACVDKEAFALGFIKAMLCRTRPGEGCGICVSCRKIEHGNHEDLYFARAAEKGHTKDEAIMELCSGLLKKPYYADRSVGVILRADTMTVRAQNRLLKVLEEPPGKTVLVLLAENRELLLPTIRSRCAAFTVNPWGDSGKARTGRETPGPADPGAGNPGSRAAETLKDLWKRAPFYKLAGPLSHLWKDREAALVFLDEMEALCGLLLREEGIREAFFGVRNPEAGPEPEVFLKRAVLGIEDARRTLQAGVSSGYGIKNMLLKLGGAL